jgi:parallel beta-helix repeat protein
MLMRCCQLVLLCAAGVACSSLPDNGLEPPLEAAGSEGTSAGRAGASSGGSSGTTAGGTGGVPSGGSAGSSGAASGKAGQSGAPSSAGGAESGGGNGTAGVITAGRSDGGSQATAGQNTGGSAGSGSAGAPASVSPGCEDSAFDAADFAHVYDVGPDQDFETPSGVPWEALEPGTLVRIHARSEPYRDKWVINARGTEAQPIVVAGVPAAGVLPVISGENAVTRAELDYWGEPRGIVKVGGANAGEGAAHVTVACLDIQNARAGVAFTDPSGASQEYADNAACVYLEEGSHVTLRGNRIHGCGNGIFASSGMSDVLISGNYVYDNGNADSVYEHNTYTEATNITFEFNHYGPLCEGCGGNALKDRSAGTVVRYNWIDGGNRQLDLVESDFEEIIGNPAYRQTLVYGNVLVEPDGAGNSQVVHYGGDGGDEAKYRKGTLYFFYNTVVSTRAGNTTLFRLSSEGERVDARNNVVWASAGGERLAISDEMGSIALAGNWLPAEWVESHGALSGAIQDNGNLEGADPGFHDPAQGDYSLCSCSPCRGAAVDLPPEIADLVPLFEYTGEHAGAPRGSGADVGAYESGG